MQIYAVESTNYCNTNCSFCPHNKMTRKKGFLSIEILTKVIHFLTFDKINNKNFYIALHHMGEPLLCDYLWFYNMCILLDLNKISSEFSTTYSDFSKILGISKINSIKLIRIAIDSKYDNFVYMTKLHKFLSNYLGYSKIYIHTVLGKDLSEFEKYDVTLHSKTFDNWAGQIKGNSQLPMGNCYFLEKNYCIIAWNGDILSCCMDYNGDAVLGNIMDINYREYNDLKNKEWERCKTCQGMQFAEGGEWKE